MEPDPLPDYTEQPSDPEDEMAAKYREVVRLRYEGNLDPEEQVEMDAQIDYILHRIEEKKKRKRKRPREEGNRAAG